MPSTNKDCEKVQLHPYDSNVFDHLNDFSLAKEELDKQQENIVQIGDLICSYRMQQIVGINLLHKHFDILKQEIVLREFVGEGKLAVMRPSSLVESPNVLPYLWQVAWGSNGYGFYPLEFVFINDIQWLTESHEAIQSVTNCSGFLTDLARLVEDLGVANIFGLVAVFSRRPFVLDPDTTLLETSDEKNRILTLRPERISTVQTMDTTKTLWLFTPPIRSGQSAAECMSHCVSHCYNHCVSHVPEQVAQKKRGFIHD